MKPIRTIYLHETDFFQEWMKNKRYIWPSKIIDQENMVGEFMREGLTVSQSSPSDIHWRFNQESRQYEPWIEGELACFKVDTIDFVSEFGVMR